MSDFESDPGSSDPMANHEVLDAIRLLEYITEEAYRITDSIKGLALISDSEYSGIRRAGEAALEAISNTSLECLMSLSPEPEPTRFQRIIDASRKIVAKCVN